MTPSSKAPATNGSGIEERNGLAAHASSGGQHAGLPSGVIHELRTPLTSIHGYAQVLQRNVRDNPRATSALNVVVRESARLSAMLASLSELAELQSDDLVTTPMEVEAHQIVDGVVHEVQRRDANAHPIEIAGEGTACCNPTLLSQAFLHVLTNATRFSPEGSPISVTIARNGDLLEIDVSDRGIGIDPDDGSRIYLPFERGATARQAGIRGLGLGLFLARAALGSTGGQIEHQTHEGGGTTFRLTVPAA